MAWFGRTGATKRGERATGRRYLLLGGRRHIADAPYVLPSDDQEINRLDFQHYMLRHALKGNYAAPLDQPASILDVGSGTARWALEMASVFPQARIVGTDLVPPKAESMQDMPRNYSFVQGNVLEGLPFPDACFDFVHMRLLLFAIPADRWPAVTRELVRVTKPGGWVESVETGAQQAGGPAMDRLVGWITEASMRRGVDPALGPHIGELLHSAGLAQINTRDIRLPVGRSGGRLGTMAAADVFAVVGSVKALVVAQGLATAEAYDAAMEQARLDLDAYNCTLPFYIAYGRRPA